MTNVAIEAVILTPMLVIQIILFPFVANTMASNWENATRDVTLKELASQMASTIQQLYLSLNQPEVSAGNITQASTFPKEIAEHTYNATGLLEASFQLGFGKVLFLTVTLQKLGNTIMVQTPLGPNVLWNEKSLFESSSANASIKVQKFVNGTLLFSF
ncbi:MAG TPA: hypothetical protein VJ249_00520 [Candidatus Bathyarchaeia archaeon]|nr:hypothetical protein [Candidatus Bathyarchaeia archaeon]